MCRISTGATDCLSVNGYERFMRKKCELLPIDPIHQVSFILAGRTEKDPQGHSAFTFVDKEEASPAPMEMKALMPFSIPRRDGFWEFHLIPLCKANAPLREILDRMKEGIRKTEGAGGNPFPCVLPYDYSEDISHLILKKTASRSFRGRVIGIHPPKQQSAFLGSTAEKTPYPLANGEVILRFGAGPSPPVLPSLGDVKKNPSKKSQNGISHLSLYPENRLECPSTSVSTLPLWLKIG